LKEWENKHKTWKKDDHEKMSCSLGPDGSYYVNAPNIGQSRKGLDRRLEKELVRRLDSKKLYDGDPASITLGAKGSYVLVGKKGDIFWDLKGEYKQLDSLLQKSEVGVEVRNLQPAIPRLLTICQLDSHLVAIQRQSLVCSVQERKGTLG
jgi:hypothetical protein